MNSIGTSSTASIIQRARENSLARLLRSCAELQDLSGGRRVHARIEQTEHRDSVYLSNLLIHMYSRCGSVNLARRVFDHIHEPNRFSWNIITCAYATNGFVELAVSSYQSMPEKTVVACTAVIEALGHLGQIERAKNFFDAFPATARDLVCSNAMLAAYARNGYLALAEAMLREMVLRNVVSWNTVLLSYAEHGDPKDAKRIFEEMPQRNEVVWMCLVAAFAEKDHSRRVTSLFKLMPCHNAGTWSVLVAMHSRGGDLARAEKMFRKMRFRNRAAWAAMFQAYLRTGELTLARDLLQRMPQQAIDLATALITAYLHRRREKLAKRIFDGLPMAATDHPCWTSLLHENLATAGYFAKSGRDDEKFPEESTRTAAPRQAPRDRARRSRSREKSNTPARTGDRHRNETAAPARSKSARSWQPVATKEQLRSLKQRIQLMPRVMRPKWRSLLKRMHADYVLHKWSSWKIWKRRETTKKP